MGNNINPHLYQKVNVFLGKDIKNLSLFDTIEELLVVGDKQRGQLTAAHERELSYIDDIEQMDGMLLQANEQIKELEKRNRELRSKTTFKVYEENLKLAQELACLKGELSG